LQSLPSGFKLNFSFILEGIKGRKDNCLID